MFVLWGSHIVDTLTDIDRLTNSEYMGCSHVSCLTKLVVDECYISRVMGCSVFRLASFMLNLIYILFFQVFGKSIDRSILVMLILGDMFPCQMIERFCRPAVCEQS